MEKAQFVDVANQGWWLLQPDLESTLDEKRKTLGGCWQWSGDLRWFTDQAKMEEVFRFIESTRPDMLRELDEAQDAFRRGQWLDNLIAAKSPPDKGAAVQDGPPVAKKPAATTPAPAAAPRKASAFGRRTTDQEPEATTTPSETPAAAATSTTTEAAEPKKPSPFGRKAAATAEPVAPEPTAAEPTASEEPAQLEQISEQVQTVMAELSAEELSSIAGDLGLTAEQVEAMVKDPDFAEMVAEEQAQLGAEGP